MMKQRNNLKSVIELLAENIKRRRSALALTQERLAELSGLSHNYIARIELGVRQPSITTLVALANALDTDVADLFSLEQPEEEAVVRTHYVDSLISDLSPKDRELVTEMLTLLVRRLRA